MAIKYTLRLKSTASPHVFVHDIKRMIKGNKELDPRLRSLLLYMKQTNKAWIQIAGERELIFYPKKFCNIERNLQPKVTQYIKTIWIKDDIELYKKSEDAFIKKMLKAFDEFGYEGNKEYLDDSKAEEILNIIEEADKKALKEKEDLEERKRKLEEEKAKQKEVTHGNI